ERTGCRGRTRKRSPSSMRAPWSLIRMPSLRQGSRGATAMRSLQPLLANADMSDHFDALETRDPELRERAVLDALPRQIAHAKAKAPAFARILAAVDPETVTSRAALAAVPVTRKSDLVELQKASRPFGGLA